MSVPVAVLVADARTALEKRAFTTTSPHVKDDKGRSLTHGTAANKKAAAALWLEYIEEGMNPDQATAELRQNGPGLQFSKNDIATGTWHARHALSLALGHTANQYTTGKKSPTKAA